jgi:putative transcriptional regulator
MRFFSFSIFTMMENEKRVYNQIKAHLALKRVTSISLARHLKVSKQTVSKWCTNTTQPSIPQLYSIAEYLKMNVFDLLEPMTDSK